jgi:hypothetical protein
MGRSTTLIALSAALAALAAAPAQAAGDGPQRSTAPPPTYLAGSRPPTVVVDRPASVAEATKAPIGDSFGTEQLNAVDASDTCRYQEAWHSRGVWPYNREHHAGTYWCYIYGWYITYRRTNTFWRVGPLCWREAHENHRISGGVGYSWVEVHSEVWFGCHTPWWFDLHDSLWMNIAYNAWGNVAVTDHN